MNFIVIYTWTNILKFNNFQRVFNVYLINIVKALILLNRLIMHRESNLNMYRYVLDNLLCIIPNSFFI